MKDISSESMMPSGCPFSNKFHPNNRKFMKLKNLETGNEFVDALCNSANQDTPCQPKSCGGSIMFPRSPEQLIRPKHVPRTREVLLKEAKEFIDGYYKSTNKPPSEQHSARWEAIQEEVAKTGTYQLTTQELTYGAKLAWRNAYRCIGRIQWNKLTLFDARYVTTASQMFDAICNHIKYATNKGNLRSAITVFPQRTDGKTDFRVWNPQLLAYAGYKNEDGTVTGDPINVEFTEICKRLGWKGKGSRWDILPMVVSANGQDPEFFPIPEEIILRVQITHPKYPWFKDLGLQWYSLPAVSGMMFDCGGIEFCACPFSGWYMSTEVAARDLCDTQRYNMLETIAKHMGLDTSTYRNLWKDQALVEINLAVLHSFQEANVTIVDHHTASDSFMKFMENEQRLRGGCPADWVWIVPPMSGSVTPVFHQEMSRYIIKPTYSYQIYPWKTHDWKKRDANGGHKDNQKKFHFKEIAGAVQFASQLFGEALSRRIKATILYATETGKSETYANMLCQVFSHAFNAQVICMDEYDIVDLEHEGLVIVIGSTFGNGDPPENGETFYKALQNMAEEYHLMASSTTTLDSVPVSDPKQPFNVAKRNVPVGQFTRSLSTPKGMNASEPRSMAVHNMSVPNTPDRSMESSRWPSVYSEAPNGSLANVRFAVFALGSSAYPNYCQFGKNVDHLLETLSGERILNCACGDELNGQEQSFKEWAADVFKASCDAFCLDSDSVMSRATYRLNSDKATSPAEVRLLESKQKDELVPGLTRCQGRQVISCVAKHVHHLHDKDTGRGTINVSVTSGGNPEKLKFQPGDHLAVYPSNRPEIVEAILKRMNRCPEGAVELQIMRKITTPLGVDKRWESHQRLPRTTIANMLSRYLDITTPPTPNMLRTLATMTTDENERNQLKRLASDTAAYETWKHDKWPNLAETLAEFPSIEVDAPFLICNMPLMQARAYSISSSPDYRLDEVQLTVAVVQYRTQGGKGPVHYGVCSNYLNELKPGDRLACYFRNAPSFHMPENKSDDIIMIGPGTGVAPFRSFWEQRLHEKKMHADDGTQFGSMSLFFGCRYREMDLYRSEKDEMMRHGVINRSHLALSRQAGVQKTYVQDQLLEQSEEISRSLTSGTSHVYVCGDCTMAEEVFTTLQNILVNKLGVTPEQARAHMEKMQETGHFHEDIFGITLRTAEVTDKTRALLVKKASIDMESGADKLPKYQRDSVSVQ